MIQINLLPPEKRKPKWDMRRIAVGISLLSLLICSGWYSFGVFRIWQCEKQFSELQAQHELLRPTEEKMNAVVKKQQIITAKNNMLVNVLTKDRKSCYSIIVYFGTIMPPHVWLNGLAMADNDSIRINGMAIQYPDIVNLLQRMEHDDMLDDPVLFKAEYDPAVAATKFEISVRLKGL